MRAMVRHSNVIFHLVNALAPVAIVIGFCSYSARYGDRPTTSLDHNLDTAARQAACGLYVLLGLAP